MRRFLAIGIVALAGAVTGMAATAEGQSEGKREVVLAEAFEADASETDGTAFLKSRGWVVASGGFRVIRDNAFGSGSMKTESSGDERSVAFSAFPLIEDDERLLLTFRARASASSTSGVGLGLVRDGRVISETIAWRNEDDAWCLDAQPIWKGSQPGNWRRVARIDDEVCRFMIGFDAAGHLFYGSVTDGQGNTWKSQGQNILASQRRTVNCVFIAGDPAGPLSVDDISLVRESAPPPVTPQAKLDPMVLELSWTSADTRFYAENVRMMEQRPFDGVVLRVAWPRTSHGNVLHGTGKNDLTWSAWGKRGFTREMIEPALEDLRSVRSDGAKVKAVEKVSHAGKVTRWPAHINEHGVSMKVLDCAGPALYYRVRYRLT